MDKDRARKLLESRKEELMKTVRAATEQGGLNSDQRSAAGEIVTIEAAELAAETLERELDLSVREAAEASLRDVERAMKRLEDGTYGSCLECGRPIPDERLEAKPEAEYCVEHQPSAA
jgi:RNA polymerase-binding transcription factor DksA